MVLNIREVVTKKQNYHTLQEQLYCYANRGLHFHLYTARIFLTF
jgi:hypothetical protein